MSSSGLTGLSNDALVERGAALEVERAGIALDLEIARQLVAARQRKLLKPGIKLGINGAIGVAGLALAPFTLSLSLLLTAIGIAMLLWDGIDYAADVSSFSTTWLRVRQLRRRALAIAQELNEMETLLTLRLGPP